MIRGIQFKQLSNGRDFAFVNLQLSVSFSKTEHVVKPKYRTAFDCFLLTYINQGYTSDEISSMIELPEALNKIWYTRQYYGTVAHNAKAVYQKFMGWYDSNPVNLNPLAPSDSAKKWVEYLGDVDKALQMAKADFDKGEYQWVAEITNAIVFADPTNIDARLLCADAMEQLGYQAESGPWRNEYLTAAQELRHGNANLTAAAKNTGEMVKALSAPMLFAPVNRTKV